MSKYIIAKKQEGSSAEKTLTRKQVTPDSKVVHMDASNAEIGAHQRKLGSDYHVELTIGHNNGIKEIKKHVIDNLQKKGLGATVGKTIEVNVEGEFAGGTEPLYGSGVTAILAETGKPPKTEQKTTNKQGYAEFTLGNSNVTVGMIMTEPAGKYWSMADVPVNNDYTVPCPLISNDGPVGWWQQLMGVNEIDPTGGMGVKVGVIDTGFGPNPALDNIIDIGSIINGVYDPKGGADNDNHGSIICGIIAGAPKQNGQYSGMSPATEVYSVRVFPKNGADANQGDVAEAIRMMVDEKNVNLINLSLASSAPSKIEHEAIQYATANGVVCICAAGNISSQVQYPAAFEESVAVGAVGLNTWGPDGSVTKVLVPADADRINGQGYYIPMFSNFGTKLTCVAPGVGLISTFPDRYGLIEAYGDLAGTSLATPMVVAFLALKISKDNEYLEMDANESRSNYVKKVLEESCSSLGLPENLEGKGVPVFNQ